MEEIKNLDLLIDIMATTYLMIFIKIREKEHHVHCHKGLSTGVQVLLSGGQEHTGAYVVGSGQAGY